MSADWLHSLVSIYSLTIILNSFIFPGMILNGFACLGLAYSECSVIMAVVFLTLSLMLHGAVSAGTLSSMVDIAPNFAGVTLGVVSTVTIIPGFISPIVVGYITFENQSVAAWKRIFEICAGMLLVTGTLYIWLNDTSLQSWNNPKKSNEDEPNIVEIEPLHKNKEIDIGKIENENQTIGRN